MVNQTSWHEVFRIIEKCQYEFGNTNDVLFPNRGNQMFVYASQYGQFDTKSTIDKKNDNGDTALHIASKNGFGDIAKKLLSEGACLHIKNNQERTALREAINNSHCNVIKVILAAQDWETAVKTGKDPITNETVTESLIKDFPKCAEMLMDNCCYKDEKGFVFDVKFHEDFHDESQREGTQRKLFNMAVNNPITVMLEKQHENLYTHPLTLIHFRHEFRNYGIIHYMWRFLSLFFFALLFKIFMMKQLNPSDDEACELYKEQCESNRCSWDFCKNGKINQTIVEDKNQNYIVFWLTVLFIIRMFYFFCFFEVVQIVHVKYWWKGGELFEKVAISTVEMVFWIAAIIVIWDDDGPQGLLSCVGWQTGVCLLPLMWLQLFFLSKNYLCLIPFVGKYVLVFYGVFLKTILVLLMLMMPTYGFVWAFHGLMKRSPVFSDPNRSSFKTLTMLFGEFELSDMFWPDPEEDLPALPFFQVSLFMVYFYMVVMCAVLMNTFISIAVDNISDYHKNAVLKDQLSALQEYDTPTLVSKICSPVAVRYLNAKHEGMLHKVIEKFYYYLAPTALFHDEESMLIHMSQEEFQKIIRTQQDRFELNSLEQRGKVMNLIKNMKTR